MKVAICKIYPLPRLVIEFCIMGYSHITQSSLCYFRMLSLTSEEKELKIIDADAKTGKLTQQTDTNIIIEIQKHVTIVAAAGDNIGGKHKWKQLYVCLLWVCIWLNRNNGANYSIAAFLFQYGNPYSRLCMTDCVAILQKYGQKEAGDLLAEYFVK